MALRVQLKATKQFIRDNERFYLVCWIDENNVSVHSEKELKDAEKHEVGSNCSVKFGRRWYTGRIASIGTKVEMLAVERAYLKGEFTPFKEPTQSDTSSMKRKRGMKNGGGDHELACGSESGNETETANETESVNDEVENDNNFIVDQQMQSASLEKRKELIMITDKNKTSGKVKGSEGQEKQQSTNGGVCSNARKKRVAVGSENKTEAADDGAESNNSFTIDQAMQSASSKKKKRKLITDKSKMSGKVKGSEGQEKQQSTNGGVCPDAGKKKKRVAVGSESENETEAADDEAESDNSFTIDQAMQGASSKKKKRKLITDKNKKNGKVKGSKGTKKQKPSNGKKKNGGGILAYGSGGDGSESETADNETNDQSFNPGKLTDKGFEVSTNLANPGKTIDKSVGDNDRNVGMSSAGNVDNPGSTNDESAHDVEGIYEGMIGGEYPEYHSEDSSSSSSDNEIPKGRKDDILKKLTLCMGNIEKQNKDMLSRVELLETNQYNHGYMMPPPWMMGQQLMIPPANNLSQSFGLTSVNSLISSPQSTKSDSSSGSSTALPTTPNKATLISTVSMKENTALPPIDHGSLISPQAVVDNHPKLLSQSQIPKLSIRLAQEAYFGKEVMSFCTFRGVGSYHALPEKQVTELKEFLRRITFPGIVSTGADFEVLWKKCIESIGQSCKTLGKLRLANLKLQ